MTKLKSEEVKAFLIAKEYLQNKYETSSDWNKYDANKPVYLKNYIGYALFGPPEKTQKKVGEDDSEALYVYKNEKATNVINLIFNKIVEHGTQLTEDKEVLCSALYCCIYDHKSLLNDTLDLEKFIQAIVIFKVKKALKTKDENRKDAITYENWYIDTEARVYQSWNDYLTENKLPECTMIAPKNGFYQTDLKEVWSDKFSPVLVEVYRLNSDKNILQTFDTASTIVTVAGLTASFAVASAVSPSYLVGLVSLTGLAVVSNISSLLSRTICSITKISERTREANRPIMFVNSIGADYHFVCMIRKYKETGKITREDIFLFAVHFFFIYNVVMKMRLAYYIIKSEQNKILQDYENSLRCERHRKAFNRLVSDAGKGETSEIHCKEQIIRSLTKITNHDLQSRQVSSSFCTDLSFDDGHECNNIRSATTSDYISENDRSDVPNERNFRIKQTLIPPSETRVRLDVDQTQDSKSEKAERIEKHEVLYKEIELLESIEVMVLNKKLVQDVLKTTGSQIESEKSLSEEMIKLCEDELDDFFTKHPSEVDFEFHDLSDELKGILLDLSNFEKKDIIFYKLIFISVNIIREIENKGMIKKNVLVNVMKFLWIFVNTNFTKILPDTLISSRKFESTVMKIIIATHWYQLAESSNWSSVYSEYQKTDMCNEKLYITPQI